MQTVLITGGAGFIGSYLAEELLKDGNKVIAVDNLSTGSIENIKHLMEDPNFRFVYDDVRNTSTMHILIEKADTIYHLAAAVGVQLIVDNPVHTIETNIHGSEIVLNIANKFKKRILLASTSEVYGKSEKVPFGEDDDVVIGSTRFSRWSYACSKMIDEFLGMAYFEQYGLPVIIVRLFNTVGPRQTGRYGMVIPRFVEQALQNKPLYVYGTGKQSRCFAYVKDVVKAMILLMKNPNTAGQVYNIGSCQEITIEELAKKIIEKTKSKSKIEYIPYEKAYGKPFDDMQRRLPNLQKLKQTINYIPETSLDTILDEIIEYTRKKLKQSQDTAKQ